MAAFAMQELKHGLALCGRNFRAFVEAWNHVVNRSAHLCGDGDTDPENGLVTVDNSDVDHPVIRFDRSRLKAGGSSESAAADLAASAFGLVEEKDDDGNVTGRTVVNCWWNAGGITRGSGASFDIGTASGVVYAKFTDGGSACAISSCADVAALGDLQSKADEYVFPLYLISDSGVVDLRTAPQLQLFEGDLA